jgi:hypothetical protein
MTDAAELVKRLRDPEFFSRTGKREELLAAADEIERLSSTAATLDVMAEVGFSMAMRKGDEVRAAQQDGAWQPIETAPKGPQIWGFGKSEEMSWQGVVCWMDVLLMGDPPHWGYVPRGLTLTHWRPLPAPPPVWDEGEHEGCGKDTERAVSNAEFVFGPFGRPPQRT